MRHRFGASFSALALGLTLVFGGTLIGCSCSSPGPAATDSESDGIAATVNGAPIYEADVTAEILAMREANGLESADAWNAFLDSMGYEPTTVREQVITRRVNEALIAAEAEARALDIDEEELDAAFAAEKASFGSDAAWQTYLDSYHQTKESHREALRVSLLTQALQRSLGQNTITDEQRLEQAQRYGESYNGAKRSSAILLNADAAAEAQDLVARLRAGELSFDEAYDQYSIDAGDGSDGGDRGWDVLNAGTFSQGYFLALSTLGIGEISDPVETPDGLAIITVTEIFAMPTPLMDIKQMPEEFRESIDNVLLAISGAELVNEWLDEQRAKPGVVEINAMPEGLPYGR